MIQHWVKLFFREEAETDGFGWAVQWIAVFFYVENGLLDPPWLGCLQAVLDVLTGLFYRLGLWKNFTKKVGMVWKP